MVQQYKLANDFRAPPGQPEWYPGERPTLARDGHTHHLIAPDEKILPVKWSGGNLSSLIEYASVVDVDGKERRVIDYYNSKGLNLLGSVLIAAFGTHRGPQRVARKLADNKISPMVLTVKGYVKGGAVNINSYIWDEGHLASQINPAQQFSSCQIEKNDFVTECWVNFFAPFQVPVIHNQQGMKEALKDPTKGYYLAKFDWANNGPEVKIYGYSGGMPVLVKDNKYAIFASPDHKGYDGNRNLLLPDKDFTPIEITGAEKLDLAVQMSQIEAMEYAADAVREFLGIEMYQDTTGNHEYRLTTEAKGRLPEINEIVKGIGKQPTEKFPMVQNPYEIQNLRTLEQILKGE
ncbi:MAG: hypothetical protein V1831_02670 [Candidatus Woesearchaeota archaeon]